MVSKINEKDHTTIYIFSGRTKPNAKRTTINMCKTMQSMTDCKYTIWMLHEQRYDIGAINKYETNMSNTVIYD